MRRFLLALALPFLLAACGAGESVWAPEEEVQRAIYSPPNEPTALTLYTVISNGANEGQHSALLINGSHRILWDPAGSWHHPRRPERNDVHFGMTDRTVEFYEDYHARESYRVVVQKKLVSPDVAEKALQLALAQGPAGNGMCSNTTTEILSQLDGFESVGRTYFPKTLMKRFGELDGVTTYTVYDNDSDDNKSVLVVQGESPL
ncbi:MULTISPECIES: hypothetical protein [Halocynthiibacter]|uniref:Lipoprotein n=1 Tax=Halocynthiibacter halioticoli TaxID=2986804 RepID=A0AAE3LPC4_9RHOB|nr:MULTISPECIES: hypothetical protein [Halocynthiibacter]MCV6823212.1 hypothetical protein [Halocynthiibacter halioticoli]MCW4056213.1 hypothetical protein [Halocynthiibacter sp. SDUM655004]MDE0590821.1 hypothetical protein [Halocynthiibacter sp. C4]